VEISSDPPLGEIRQVLGVVAPPGAMIVPEVMERVVCGSDRKNRSVDSWCAHGRDEWGWSHQEPGQIKKRPLDRMIRKGALVKPGEIFVQRISPAAHRFAFAYQPPWDFSVPGWHPLVLPKGIPDVLTFIAEIISASKRSI
jgi:hypothetical protein